MRTRLRRLFPRLLFIVAAFGTLIVLLYAEENWRGTRAWATAKRDLQAQGESLDARDFIPPPVPDDQNLAMAPLFVRTFQYEVDPSTHALTFHQGTAWQKGEAFKQMEEIPWGKEKPGRWRPGGYGNWMTGHAIDLSVWQRYFRQHPDFPHAAQPQAPADDVLLALTHWQPLLDELAQEAGQRPKMRAPTNWAQRPPTSISMPHLNQLLHLTMALRMRTVAELAVGQTAGARRDLTLGFRLHNGMENDPSLIAPLVDITGIGLLTQAVWEGLAARRWSAEDLDALRDDLRRIQVLREYRQAVRGERALFLAGWAEALQDQTLARQYAKVTPVMFDPDVSSPPYSLEGFLRRFIPHTPRGWFLQNLATACRWQQEYIVDCIDPDGNRVSLAKSKGAASALAKMPTTPTSILAKQVLGGLSELTERFAQAQTVVDQAATACALERYYLDHQTYPKTLSALVPAYLDHVPNDVIDGAPMRYRLTVDGRYQLWSIAWNGTDEGGSLEWAPGRTWRRPAAGTPPGQAQNIPGPARDCGDWVWQYAPAEPPDPPANASRLESLAPAGIIQG